MNCYLHPDTTATAFCRACGRPLCAVCQRTADGTIFCQEHAPVPASASAPDANASGAGAANPYFQAAPPVNAPPVAAKARMNSLPGLAFALGFIPGVGAIYNGQYLKGLVHAVILGMLISLANGADGTSGQPLIIMTVVAFIFYMPFEAYHTAKKRQLGMPVEEWSSLVGQSHVRNRAPVGPILLIVIGVLFLLDTMNVIHFREVGRFWPVLLIAVGAYLLWSRVSTHPPAAINHSYPPAGNPYAAGPNPYAQGPYAPGPYAPAPDPAASPIIGTRHE